MVGSLVQKRGAQGIDEPTLSTNHTQTARTAVKGCGHKWLTGQMDLERAEEEAAAAAGEAME